MEIINNILLGLVEGITEFLPISSTGHLILTKSLLGLTENAVDRQLIIIQGAAILAVCWHYRLRLWNTVYTLKNNRASRILVTNIFIAFFPLAFLGLILGEKIERFLFSPIPVALALVIGGVLMLWVESKVHQEKICTIEQIKPIDAFKIGLFQAAALVPGTSRAAATILGGLLTNLSRHTATEFSFFVAIPTLLAATIYKLFKARAILSTTEIDALIISSAVAFISALVTIRWLLKFIAQHSFAVFAWYRIIFGGVILVTCQLGWVRW